MTITAPIQAGSEEGLPTRTQSGRLRRGLQLEADLDDARAARCQVLLSGPGVHDLLLDSEGRALWLPDALRSYCARRGLGLVVYRLGAGAKTYPTLSGEQSIPVRPGSTDEHPAQTFTRIVEDMRAHGAAGLLVIDYLESMLPIEGSSDLGRSLMSESIQALTADIRDWQLPGLQLILVDRGGGVARRLTSQPGLRTVTVDPPDATEISMYVRRKTQSVVSPPMHLDLRLTPEEVGVLAGGLLLRHLGELASVSSPEDPVTSQRLSRLKGRGIREQSNGGLDLFEDSVTFADVAGMHGLRLYLDDLQRQGRRTARICLVGPPGTGKTYCAQAVAAHLGVPMVAFGQILGELLGEAENNMRRVLSMLRAMDPILLFIDEADEGPLSVRDGSGRTSNEAYTALRSMLFTFLGDPEEDNGISVVATTNAPGRLDAAAQSRFSFLPVLFPSGPELAVIMNVHARRAGIPIAEDLSELLSAYAASPGQALSGRSAQRVLAKAWSIALRSGACSVGARHVRQALALRSGSDWNLAAEYSTLSALWHCDFADAHPWVAARHLGEPYPIPAYLQPYLDTDGSLAAERVQQRLRELEASGVYG